MDSMLDEHNSGVVQAASKDEVLIFPKFELNYSENFEILVKSIQYFSKTLILREYFEEMTRRYLRAIDLTILNSLSCHRIYF